MDSSDRKINQLTKRIVPQTQGQETAVMLILNKDGKILLVQEGEADINSGKKIGDWGLISETHEPREGLKSNFIRAIREELGTDPEIMDNLKVIRGSHHESDYLFDSNTGHARVFLFRLMGDDQNLRFSPKNPKEIIGYCWAGIEEIRQLNSKNQLVPSVFQYIQQFYEKGLIKPHVEQELLDNIRLPVDREEKMSKA